MYVAQTPLALGFLASHNGSSMRAIVSALHSGKLVGDARIVISNNSQSPALDFARDAGISALCINSNHHVQALDADHAIAAALESAEVNLVILSGYMRKIGP